MVLRILFHGTLFQPKPIVRLLVASLMVLHYRPEVKKRVILFFATIINIQIMIKVLEHTFFAQNCDIMITVSETNSLHKL